MSHRSNVTTDQLMDGYKNGESVLTLSQRHGISERSIRNRFFRVGFKLRSHRDSTLNSFKRERRRWKNGRRKTADGYVLILCHGHPRANRDGYVREHILVWEKANGKPVPKGRYVHHLNGIKDDNRPENLIAVDQRSHHTRMEPYKERIKELEQEITRLKQKVFRFKGDDY